MDAIGDLIKAVGEAPPGTMLWVIAILAFFVIVRWQWMAGNDQNAENSFNEKLLASFSSMQQALVAQQSHTNTLFNSVLEEQRLSREDREKSRELYAKMLAEQVLSREQRKLTFAQLSSDMESHDRVIGDNTIAVVEARDAAKMTQGQLNDVKTTLDAIMVAIARMKSNVDQVDELQSEIQVIRGKLDQIIEMMQSKDESAPGKAGEQTIEKGGIGGGLSISVGDDKRSTLGSGGVDETTDPETVADSVESQ